MKFNHLIFIFLISVIFCCSLFRREKGISYFEFVMNDKTYQILSVNAPKSGPPYNQISGEDFIAIDLRQDQNIDKVVIGDNKRIKEYEKIYNFGIQKALKEGKLKKKEDIYYFEYSTSMKYYNIITYYPAYESPYNEFIYIEAFTMKKVIKAIDRDADGILDSITSGIYELEKLQKEYSNFIKTGIGQNRIVNIDNKYLVVPED